MSGLRSKLAAIGQYMYRVPWCVPQWGAREARATAATILTGHVTRGGKPARFAAAVTALLGVRYAVPVNRGRTAIEVGLRALGVGQGDDVVLPSYICVSVLDAVQRAGATPVFADVGRDLNVTAATVSAALTSRTRCVIVAHLFGTAAPIDEIETLLAARGIPLMDDAAQALGARRGGRLVGTFGACGIVSCGPAKPLAGAAGGLLITNDHALYERARAVPLTPEPSGAIARRTLSFWVWRRLRRYTLPLAIVRERLFGANAEPDDVAAPLANLDAAIALAQLDSLDEHIAVRRRNAGMLAARLTELGTPRGDLSTAGAVVKLAYVIDADGPALADVLHTLANAGIEAQGGFSPLHEKVGTPSDVPYTMAVWQRVLCVPVETDPGTTAPIRFPRLAAAALAPSETVGAGRTS